MPGKYEDLRFHICFSHNYDSVSCRIKVTASRCAKQTSVRTSPQGLATIVTYNSGTTLPVDAGKYPTVVTIVDSNYRGAKDTILVIEKANQQIAF